MGGETPRSPSRPLHRVSQPLPQFLRLARWEQTSRRLLSGTAHEASLLLGRPRKPQVKGGKAAVTLGPRRSA